MAKGKIMQSCFCPSKKVPQILIPVTDELLWVLKPSALSEGRGGALQNTMSAQHPRQFSPAHSVTLTLAFPLQANAS